MAHRKMAVGKVIPLVLAVLIVQFNQCLSTKDTEVRKGPNPDPKPSTNSFRSRFPVHVPKTLEPKSKSGGVQILESLTRSSNILKNNPSLHGTPGTPGTKSDTRSIPDPPEIQKRQGDYDDLFELESYETEGTAGGSYSPMPVFPNTPRPQPPPGLGMPGYGYNKPKPTVVSYKPGGTAGPELVFPPVTEPQIIGPMSTFAPVGPPLPSGTLVPIIGGPDSGGSGGETAPAPPEDIFPPSPPEIESVGRSLPLRSSSPRTRVSNVGAIPPSSSREASSLRRGGAQGLPGSPGRGRSGSGSSGSPGLPGGSGDIGGLRSSGSPGLPGGSGDFGGLRSSGSPGLPGGSGDFGGLRSSGSPGLPGGSGDFGGLRSSGSPGLPGGSGSSNKRVRLRDKVRASLESLSDDTDSGDPGLDPNVITDFVFSDIKCFKTRSKEYFGTTIHMKNGYHIPYIRDRAQDPLTSNECRMDKVPGSIDTFHMTVTDLRGCGVEQCGDYMCLTMVFPRVPTLALADDEVTTIKCLPQKSTMADTRTISFAGDSLDNRRSSSTVEGGGQEFAAEVGVFRQNPGSTNGLYVKRVNSGGVVQLGEPLQLRSIVRGGDGWKHSRLSDVKVWRMRDTSASGNLDNLDPNDASEVITLVDGHGCRNSEYVVIADSHPLKDPRNELVNHFTFKAFLFRGQRANEPLVLTAKVHACHEDIDCSPGDCVSTGLRSKRSPTEIRNASAIIHNWDSRLALRVVGLKDHSASLTEEDFPQDYIGQGRNASDAPLTCAEKMAAAGLGGGFIVLFLCGLCLALYAYVIKGKASRMVKPVPFSTAFVENGNSHRRNPTIQIGQAYPCETIRGKPLPLPPTCSQGSSGGPGNDKLSKSEISNVAKLLQKLADNKNPEGQNTQEQTQYECIDERSSASGSTESSENNNPSSHPKKSDGVYIVYCCKDKKGRRPKSAPSSLRGKRGSRKCRKNVSNGIYEDPPTEDSISSSQTEVTEESEDSSEDLNNNTCTKSPFGRRTVRSVKGRSSHHSKHKVVSGIRRRLSSLYKDGRMQNPRNNVTSESVGCNTKSGSFPSRQKMRSSRGHHRRSGDLFDDIYSSNQMSSDLDSAYFGSEFNEDATRYEEQMRRGQGRMSGYHHETRNMDSYGDNHRILTSGHVQHQQSLQNDIVLKDIKMQLRNAAGQMGGGSRSQVVGVGMGPASPPLEPGQTKAAHFVTRNESSTQILIVPETHV